MDTHDTSHISGSPLRAGAEEAKYYWHFASFLALKTEHPACLKSITVCHSKGRRVGGEATFAHFQDDPPSFKWGRGGGDTQTPTLCLWNSCLPLAQSFHKPWLRNRHELTIVLCVLQKRERSLLSTDCVLGALESTVQAPRNPGNVQSSSSALRGQTLNSVQVTWMYVCL